MRYLTEDIVSSVRLSGFIPSGDTTFTDDNLTFFANEEMQNKIVPHILSVRADYFLTYKDVPVTANLGHYAIPSRAIGNALKDVFWITDSSNLENRYPIPKSSPHEIRSWGGGTSSPGVFYMQGDEVVLVPTPTGTTSTLRFYYFRKPSKLVATSSCAKITSIVSAAGLTTFTVDTDLTASLSVGSTIDFTNGQNPHLPWADDVVIQAITSTTIQVNTSDVSDEVGNIEPGVGDYISAAGTSCVPQLPEEFHVILAEMVVCRCLAALGAVQNLQVKMANVKELLADSFKLISNRVEDEIDVVFERNSILSAVQNSSYRFTTK